MEVANTLAYYVTATNKAVKSFMVQAPGAFDAWACTIKLFKVVIYELPI